MSSRRQTRSKPSRIPERPVRHHKDVADVSTKMKTDVVRIDAPTTVSSDVLDDGCKICLKDDDHANLLICEHCNCEVHTYCVGLTKVPEDDFYCPDCAQEFAVDPLEKLVKGLPETYTKRFGEICWAHGGTGFGWWPACIYDPRLTVGGARELAIKHAGKRHLVYFFECHSAPFTVCRADKITKWEEGIANGFTAGKIARAASMQRSVDFDKAYASALCERLKPIDQRMDFNHFEQEALNHKRAMGKSRDETVRTKKRRKGDKASVIDGDTLDNRANKRSRKKQTLNTDEYTEIAALEGEEKISCRAEEIKSSYLRSFYGKMSSASSSEGDKAQLRIPVPNIDEDGMCYCKVILKESQSFVNIGFIVLTSRWKSCFVEARKFMTEKLDDETLKAGWKFYVPKLGPLSSKQEEELRVMPFLSSTALTVRKENGTCRTPIRLFVIQNSESLQDSSVVVESENDLSTLSNGDQELNTPNSVVE